VCTQQDATQVEAKPGGVKSPYAFGYRTPNQHHCYPAKMLRRNLD
jgi:hypothetical protein